jgi:hypothetical protein
VNSPTDTDVEAGKAAFFALLGGETIETIGGERFLDRSLALVTTICSMTTNPEGVLEHAIGQLQVRLEKWRRKQ